MIIFESTWYSFWYIFGAYWMLCHCTLTRGGIFGNLEELNLIFYPNGPPNPCLKKKKKIPDIFIIESSIPVTFSFFQPFSLASFPSLTNLLPILSFRIEMMVAITFHLWVLWTLTYHTPALASPRWTPIHWKATCGVSCVDTCTSTKDLWDSISLKLLVTVVDALVLTCFLKVMPS